MRGAKERRSHLIQPIENVFERVWPVGAAIEISRTRGVCDGERGAYASNEPSWAACCRSFSAMSQ